MVPEKCVWVFMGTRGVPSGVFTTIERAEAWISLHGVGGTLSAFPIDEGCFDWAVRCNVTNLEPEKFPTKKHDPDFVGNFLTASQEHFHYEDGKRH